jgi:hypothetical protein
MTVYDNRATRVRRLKQRRERGEPPFDPFADGAPDSYAGFLVRALRRGDASLKHQDQAADLIVGLVQQVNLLEEWLISDDTEPDTSSAAANAWRVARKP